MRGLYSGGGIGEVKHAADIKEGVAESKGTFTDFALDADIPASSQKGALEALGAQLDFEEDALSLLRHGLRAPLRVNAMGHYIVSVVEFGRGPAVAASHFEWSDGGCLPGDWPGSGETTGFV